jgi:hypothetical protein
VREAGALVKLHPEQLAQQSFITDLRAHSSEGGGDLRVEAVARVGVPESPQQRNILAARMDNYFDSRVIDQLDDWGRIDLAVKWVYQLGPGRVAKLVGIDCYLNEAELGAVAPFTHELRVKRQRAGLSCTSSEAA